MLDHTAAQSVKPSVEYYPSDYDEARRDFLKLVESIKGSPSYRERPIQSESFQVPSSKDSNLFVDYFYLPPTQQTDTLLVLVSGVHGMEAFTGHAVQKMFMSELLDGVPQERVGVLVVHSLNPYGFKYGRRATENNVNLNRNFAVDDSLFANVNKEYERLASFVDPGTPLQSTRLAFLRTCAFIGKSVTWGPFSGSVLNQALAQGQFAFPRGMEYGGRAREPQITHFIEVLRRTMAGYRDITVCDLHTGLGDRYELHLIPSEEPESNHPELFKRLFEPREDQGLYVYTPTDTEGFYSTFGDLNRMVPKFTSAQQRVVALTFEFGTLGNGTLAKLRTLTRLLQENQAHHYGCANEQAAEDVRNQYLELFAPTEKRWRENTVIRTREIFKRILKRLS